MPLTPLERWQATLQRRPVDRIPTDYWATPEATARLLAHLRCADASALYRRLEIDHVFDVRPAYIGPPRPADCNPFGCRFADIPYPQGIYRECVGHPLAAFDTISAVEAHYTWPTADWCDFGVLPARLRGREDYPIRAGGSEPFLVYTELRGLERAYRDLKRRPDLVHHCLQRLYDLAYEMTRRCYEAIPGRVLLTYVAEDLGSQESLLFAPETIRTFFLPHMRRMADLVHQAGAYVFCHSDGAIRPIIPDLLEIGIDILNPVQWRCAGMDRAALKRDFGSRVVFHGGVDNQQTLAFGTPADVRCEVEENIATLGAGGGYIVAPCHNIQAISPPENIVALYEAAREASTP